MILGARWPLTRRWTELLKAFHRLERSFRGRWNLWRDPAAQRPLTVTQPRNSSLGPKRNWRTTRPGENNCRHYCRPMRWSHSSIVRGARTRSWLQPNTLTWRSTENDSVKQKKPTSVWTNGTEPGLNQFIVETPESSKAAWATFSSRVSRTNTIFWETEWFGFVLVSNTDLKIIFYYCYYYIKISKNLPSRTFASSTSKSPSPSVSYATSLPAATTNIGDGKRTTNHSGMKSVTFSHGGS